jgi:transposase
MRAGELTPGYVPQVADEAVRALRRARADARSELQAAKSRLNAFVLRHDLRETGRATWGPAPRRGRSAVVWPPPAPQVVFQASVRTVTEHTARLQRLAHALQDHLKAWRLAPVIDALHALRGVPCTVAVPMVAALGDRMRVDTPRPLLSSLGLPPSAYASGERRRQGAITKAGNPHARRAFSEGAWASRSPANVSRPLPWRLENVPQRLPDIRWKAPVRLWKRDRPLCARGPHANHVVVAMARELADINRQTPD